MITRPHRDRRAGGRATSSPTTSSTAPAGEAPGFGGRRAARAVRWSSLSVIGRQGLQIVFALLVARLIGPQAYGAVGAATLLVTLSTLLLDQGLAAALVQRDVLPEGSPGAAMSVNLGVGALLAVVVVLVAPALGGFFATPDLPGMLIWLGPGLLLKAAAVVPRAMLLRGLRLRVVAIAEVVGAAVGAVVGLASAFAGAGPAAMVVMTLLTDAVVGAGLLAVARGPVPNLRLRAFQPLLAFGGRVFATNAVAYASRNTDTVLVGRFLGPAALAQYSMAYRVLVIPVQFLGQSVNRVMFPVLSRLQGRRVELAAQLTRATELLALFAIPPMALIACAAPQLVGVVLGAKWAAAAPVMAVLAIAGARETVFYITPVLLRAVGEARLGFRFQLLSTAIQVVGIVAGLPFGMLGVAIGYTIAGFALTPVLLVLQRRYAGVSIAAQVRALWPPLHASLWGALAYLLVAGLGAALPGFVVLVVGVVLFLLVVAAVLRLAHPLVARSGLRRVRAVLGVPA